MCLHGFYVTTLMCVRPVKHCCWTWAHVSSSVVSLNASRSPISFCRHTQTRTQISRLFSCSRSNKRSGLMWWSAPLSLSEASHICHWGSCTQTAISQLSWPLPSVWRWAHEPVTQNIHAYSNSFTCHVESGCVCCDLSLVRVELRAHGACSAQLLLQFTGALHVHVVSLLQQTHLSAQISQILQLALIRVHHRLQTTHTIRWVPDRQMTRTKAAVWHACVPSAWCRLYAKTSRAFLKWQFTLNNLSSCRFKPARVSSFCRTQ